MEKPTLAFRNFVNALKNRRRQIIPLKSFYTAPHQFLVTLRQTPCISPRIDSLIHTHQHYTTTGTPLQSSEFARVSFLTYLNMLFTFVPFYLAHNWPSI
jgi:hypothetical protein